MKAGKKVGGKIKSLRESRGVSLEELSEKSGISIAQIELIESDTNFPSLAPLIKIARALGTRLGTFLDGETEIGPSICRKEDHSEGIRFSQSTNIENGHLDFFPLAEQKTGRNMEPFFIEIYPNKEISKSSSHEGEEFLYVLQGTLSVKYGKKEYTLNAGDSIYYDSIVEHLVYNSSNEVCKILAIVYAPF